MARLISNGGTGDYVRGAFEKLASQSRTLLLAAPYFSNHEPISEALKRGASLRLIVGLNSATHPHHLRALVGSPRTAVRFYTGRFHAKLYVFDNAALVGSANLTEAGFQSNREVVACFTEPDDSEPIIQARAIFEELWSDARAMSRGTLDVFEEAWRSARRIGPDPEAAITNAVGKVEPPSVNVERRKSFADQAAREALRRQIEEQYRPAFDEVARLLADGDLYRDDVMQIDAPFRVNRFLNWVRLTHALHDDWKEAPLRAADERRAEIVRLGQAWRDAEDGKVFEGYAEGIQDVLAPFAEPEILRVASKAQITAGLMGIHAFQEQMRFTAGGREALPRRFWAENNDDVARVRDTLTYLLHGPGDFVDRLYGTTADARWKLALFGKFCGLELCGTVRPQECPPVNGRSAKALRFLGFNVSGE
ncbi:phospholipase D-like domain-containing protein [Neoroseomonas soli]|uniref:Phospholipase D n=1 Tax=Neoroseomonas soli TaxID=1081025 RepID=A0A9X9X274_9PROT|nr:phospholipase D-like domain-containing protein [Neoroseomonas soli]MBR0673503.1 hypothetical protein [Neoroseomonas soli]